MPAVTPNKSVSLPTKGGINAPPDTAIIIKPEISLARCEYLLTVIENINGKILAAANPMINMSANASSGVGE